MYLWGFGGVVVVKATAELGYHGGAGVCLSYRVSVRQTWVSRVFLAPLGSSRYRQEWTWALAPWGGTSGCSVDTEDR